MGWRTDEDTLLGDIVKHDGGLPSGRSILLKNHTKKQTIILFNNHSNNVILIADDALKVAKPKKSGAKAYGIALANGGVEAGNKVLAKKKIARLII